MSVFSGGGSHFAPYTAGSGTRNTPQLLAHGVAMDFYIAIGRERIQRRTLALNGYLRDHLAADVRLQPVTPADPELASAMVSYRVQGMGVNALYSALQERGIIIKRTGYNWVVADNAIPAENASVIRLSTHIHNSEEQIDRFVDALQSILDDAPSPVLSVDTSKPTTFALDPNYPNPFNSSTTIRYQLPAADNVEVAVFNARGQLVDVLRDGWEQVGAHQLRWDAPGRASGTYYCRVTTGDQQDVRKMLLLR